MSVLDPISKKRIKEMDKKAQDFDKVIAERKKYQDMIDALGSAYVRTIGSNIMPETPMPPPTGNLIYML